MNEGERTQRERLARRLKAVYVAEMAGLSSVDRLYRKFAKEPIDAGWTNLADQILEVFHDLFIVQTSTDPGGRGQALEAKIKFDQLDISKHKRH
jgi:hypothetical protein